ncbi:MAG TPA: hypothetical protein VJU78_18425 [Chitinophagaceae bacterium]|nr:hypothetical protein [Chitinophagaceae bacterium]
MINSFFFISDTLFEPDKNLLGEDSIYFSFLVNPSIKESLDKLYIFSEKSTLSRFSLTLDIHEVPIEESIKFVTAFLFLPCYLRIEQQPVINLSGTSQELLVKTKSAFSAYLSSQGFNNVIINLVTSSVDQPENNGCRLFTSSSVLLKYYKQVLQSDQFYNNSVFFYAHSMEVCRETLLLLRQAESEFKESYPTLYRLADNNRILERELGGLRKKIAFTETELNHQKQYNDILRSEHSTKELQRYYDQEYEILPKWYKRFGHILKVITGKRTFRSLFSDEVKKYKN